MQELNPYNIDASLVEAAITPRTVAILPADQIGLAADLPALIDIAKKHNLKLIEDAAPALGAMVGEGRVGNLGDFTCFSFDARKILTTGEGGMVTTNDGDAAERMRSLRAHAASVPTIVRHTATSVVLERYPELGYNYKLTDIQAAIGIVQMSRIDAIVNERRRLAHRYNGLLKANNHLVTPIEPAGYRHVYQSYCVRLKSQKSQVDVMTALAAQGIATRRITAMHLEPFYRRLFPDLSLPESERACSESLLLPLFVGLTDREQEEVVNALVGAVD
jgi:perosamine synthetase